MKLLRRTTGLVGVDIGSQSVKVAQLARRGGELVLQRAAIMECDQPLSLQAAAGQAAMQTTDLKAVLRACDRLRGRSAAVTLSMKFCEYQAQPIRPDADEAELASAASELSTRETQLAGSVEHGYWMSTTRQPARGAASATLHVLSTAAATAETIARDHRAGGYTCQILDGLPLALARALRVGGYSTAQPVAAIDWGFQRATLCVVSHGEPAFVRTLRGGEFGPFVAQLSAALNVSPVEARRIATAPGLPQPAGESGGTIAPRPTVLAELQKRTADAIGPALAAFRDELERSLAYLRMRHAELVPAELVLFGGGAAVANAAEHVAAWAGVPARAWDFPHVREADAESPPDSDMPVGAGDRHVGARLGVTMNHHLNLLPFRVQYRQTLWSLSRKWLVVAAVALLAALGVAWRTWAGYVSTIQRQSELQGAVQSARQTLDEVKNMQRQLKATRRQQAVALALADERPVLTLLGLVSGAASASDIEVAVEKLAFTAAPLADGVAKTPAAPAVNRLELRGVGRDNVAVARFVAAIREAGVFAQVDLKATAPSQMGSVQVRTFHIECLY